MVVIYRLLDERKFFFLLPAGLSQSIDAKCCSISNGLSSCFKTGCLTVGRLLKTSRGARPTCSAEAKQVQDRYCIFPVWWPHLYFVFFVFSFLILFLIGSSWERSCSNQVIALERLPPLETENISFFNKCGRRVNNYEIAEKHTKKGAIASRWRKH